MATCRKARIALSAGLIAFSATLPAYKSWNPVVLNRWSLSWTLVIITTWIVTLLAIYWAAKPIKETQNTFGVKSLIVFALALWSLTFVAEYWIRWRSADTEASFRVPFGAVTVPGVLSEIVSIALLCTAAFASIFRAASRLDNSTLRATLQRASLLLGSLVFALVLLEAGFRVRNLVAPGPMGLPTPSGRIFKWRYYQRNSLGFRDEEPSRAKDEKTLRIICIGDSLTEAVGVRSEDERLTEVLERRLGRLIPEGEIQVVNAGIGDTHTVQHTEWLPNLLKLKPNFVVLIYSFNDIEHASPPVRWDAMNPVKRTLLAMIVNNSHLGSELIARLRNLGMLNYEPETSPYSNDAVMKEHLVALRSFFQLCEDKGVPAALAPFDHGVAQQEQFYVNRYDRFCRAVSNSGIELWRLDQCFKESDNKDFAVSSTDGHPNERAHRLVGEELAKRLLVRLKN